MIRFNFTPVWEFLFNRRRSAKVAKERLAFSIDHSTFFLAGEVEKKANEMGVPFPKVVDDEANVPIGSVLIERRVKAEYALKPCPLCGGMYEFSKTEADLDTHYAAYTICCVNTPDPCGLAIGHYFEPNDSASEAMAKAKIITRWNTRAGGACAGKASLEAEGQESYHSKRLSKSAAIHALEFYIDQRQRMITPAELELRKVAIEWIKSIEIKKPS